MPRMGFESKTPVFERSKTVHALHRAAVRLSVNNYSLDKYMDGSGCGLISVNYLKCVKRDGKNSIRIVDVPEEIRTGYFPNTSQKRYRLSQSVRQRAPYNLHML
jgi:hypothetical protein